MQPLLRKIRGLSAFSTMGAHLGEIKYRSQSSLPCCHVDPTSQISAQVDLHLLLRSLFNHPRKSFFVLTQPTFQPSTKEINRVVPDFDTNHVLPQVSQMTSRTGLIKAGITQWWVQRKPERWESSDQKWESRIRLVGWLGIWLVPSLLLRFGVTCVPGSGKCPGVACKGMGSRMG